jgi:hypothetical protein
MDVMVHSTTGFTNNSDLNPWDQILKAEYRSQESEVRFQISTIILGSRIYFLKLMIMFSAMWFSRKFYIV